MSGSIYQSKLITRRVCRYFVRPRRVRDYRSLGVFGGAGAPFPSRIMIDNRSTFIRNLESDL